MLEANLNLEGTAGVPFMHYRCIAHIINLAVSEALKKLKLSIREVHDMVLTVRSSTKRSEKFKQIQKDMIEEFEIILDKPYELVEPVDTRWNSTYLMLERVLMLRDVIVRATSLMTELADFRYIDFGLIETVTTFLKPFYDVTKLLSYEKKVTLSLVSSLIPRLIQHSEQTYDESCISNAAREARDKLNWYSSYTDRPVIVLATILDPRIKQHFLPADVQYIGAQLLKQYMPGEDLESSLESVSTQS